jgi:hypothetical protein
MSPTKTKDLLELLKFKLKKKYVGLYKGTPIESQSSMFIIFLNWTMLLSKHTIYILFKEVMGQFVMDLSVVLSISFIWNLGVAF